MSKRKYLTPEQKVSIVRRLLVEKVPASDLCDEFGKRTPEPFLSRGLF